MKKLFLLFAVAFIVQACQQIDDALIEEQIQQEKDPELGILKTGYYQGRQITYREIDGLKLFEGDIILRDDEVSNTPQPAVALSLGLKQQDRLWPNATVYYKFRPDHELPINNLTPHAYKCIAEAIQHYHDNTDIKFIQGEPPIKGTGFLVFERNAFSDVSASATLGYHSNIGQVTKMNIVALPGFFLTTEMVIHELGHVLGLEHEQNRPDRDEYVNIHWENIEHGREHNFKKVEIPTTSTGESSNSEYSLWSSSFDIESIMMYHYRSFSKNGFETITKRVRVPGKPETKEVYSVSTHLSKGDKLALARMYGYKYNVVKLYMENKSFPDIGPYPDPGYREINIITGISQEGGRRSIEVEKTISFTLKKGESKEIVFTDGDFPAQISSRMQYAPNRASTQVITIHPSESSTISLDVTKLVDR